MYLSLRAPSALQRAHSRGLRRRSALGAIATHVRRGEVEAWLSVNVILLLLGALVAWGSSALPDLTAWVLRLAALSACGVPRSLD
jgi:hypothetical protein